MAFMETLKLVPHPATKPKASGFTPPILRASIHLTYILACEANPAMTLKPEEAIEELKSAQEYWNSITLPAPGILSTEIQTKLAQFSLLIADAITEYPTWDEATKTRNIKSLADRAIGFGVSLDRELVGLDGSDAGLAM